MDASFRCSRCCSSPSLVESATFSYRLCSPRLGLFHSSLHCSFHPSLLASLLVSLLATRCSLLLKFLPCICYFLLPASLASLRSLHCTRFAALFCSSLPRSLHSALLASLLALLFTTRLPSSLLLLPPTGIARLASFPSLRLLRSTLLPLSSTPSLLARFAPRSPARFTLRYSLLAFLRRFYYFLLQASLVLLRSLLVPNPNRTLLLVPAPLPLFSLL